MTTIDPCIFYAMTALHSAKIPFKWLSNGEIKLEDGSRIHSRGIMWGRWDKDDNFIGEDFDIVKLVCKQSEEINHV